MTYLHNHYTTTGWGKSGEEAGELAGSGRPPRKYVLGGMGGGCDEPDSALCDTLARAVGLSTLARAVGLSNGKQIGRAHV